MPKQLDSMDSNPPNTIAPGSPSRPMQRLRILLVASLGTIAPAAAQDYLSDDREPPDVASEMLSPFSELKEPEAQAFRLGAFSDQPFVRDAVFSLQPRFYYRSVRNRFGVQDTFAGGGSMGLTTGWLWNAIQFGAVGYTTQPLVAVKNNNRSGLVTRDGDGFFTLGEAWTKLKAGPATATLFRQVLNLPFINANDSRMIPNTFQAYQLEVKPWSFLRVNAGYITHIKGRDTADFVSMSEAAGAPEIDRGTSFAGVLLGSEDKSYLGAMNEVTWDLFSCTYAQGGHTWIVSPEVEIRGDLQFADQRSVGSERIGSFDTQLYGARLATSCGGALLSFAYTGTARGAGLRDPFGADPGFNGLMISNFALEGEQAFGPGITYNFERIGLRGVTAFANYVYGVLPESAWEQEINVTVDYRINSGPLSNFWLRLRYAHNEGSGRVPIEDFRVILNYAFNF